jgi:hypothetical protein
MGEDFTRGAMTVPATMAVVHLAPYVLSVEVPCLLQVVDPDAHAAWRGATRYL